MTAMPVLDELLASTRPVFFETGVEEAPYAGQGSCFVARLGMAQHVVTLTHVVGSTPAEDILVFPTDDARDALPFRQVHRIDKPAPRRTRTLHRS